MSEPLTTSEPTTQAPLTVEILKKLPFCLHMHVNGGSKFSKRITQNEAYGLFIVNETNGSPNYKMVAKRLTVAGAALELDLLKGIPDYAAFCEAYNLVRPAVVAPTQISA